jgi:hypothetical protein
MDDDEWQRMANERRSSSAVYPSDFYFDNGFDFVLAFVQYPSVFCGGGSLPKARILY